MDYGVYLTVGPEILHSKYICEIATLIPWSQLLTETDNPGGLKSFLVRVGMPLLIKDVVFKLAELRNCSYDDIIQTVHHNMLHLTENDPGLEPVYKRLRDRQNGDTQSR